MKQSNFDLRSSNFDLVLSYLITAVIGMDFSFPLTAFLTSFSQDHLSSFAQLEGECLPVNFFLTLSFCDKKVLWYIGKWLVKVRSTRSYPIIYRKSLFSGCFCFTFQIWIKNSTKILKRKRDFRFFRYRYGLVSTFLIFWRSAYL